MGVDCPLCGEHCLCHRACGARAAALRFPLVRFLILSLNLVAPFAFAALWYLGHFWTGLAVLFAAHMLALFATLMPNCGWWGAVMSRFPTGEKEIWLTIDDGPDLGDSDGILDLLDAHGAKATFFLIGALAESFPVQARAILDRGHQIGHHTFTHPEKSFWRLGKDMQAWEIDRGLEAFMRVFGIKPALFRAPAGLKNWRLHPLLKARAMRLVGWSARGYDGSISDPEKVLAKLLPQVRPGAILLVHQGREHSVQILRRLLEHLESSGFRCVLPVGDPVLKAD
jgi:peptidoglycan/xylan/chitin deacetylase (PgdA/CDA1 family)